MGMAAGAYKADKDNADRRLRARQISNQHMQAMMQMRLRQREMEQRDKRYAEERELTLRKLDAADKQQKLANERAERKDNAYLQHMQNADRISSRADERAEQLFRMQTADASLAYRNAERERSAQEQKYSRQQQIFRGYQQLGEQAQAQQAQKRDLASSAIASAMKIAMTSGKMDASGVPQKGAVPTYVLEALNRDMGFDGKTQGFVSGGFMENGNFHLDYGQRDPQTGQLMAVKPQIMDPIMQYRVMNQQLGIFDNNDRGAMAMQLRKSGYRDDEIMQAQGLNQAQIANLRKAATSKQVQDASLKDRMNQLTMIGKYLEGENGANLDDETRNLLNSAYKNGIMQMASQFMPQQQTQTANVNNGLQMTQDGMLVMDDANHTTLRPNQEYRNPKDGNVYVWDGNGNDPVANFKMIRSGNNGNSQSQEVMPATPAQKPMSLGDYNNLMGEFGTKKYADLYKDALSQGDEQTNGDQTMPGYEAETMGDGSGLTTPKDDSQKSNGASGGAAAGAAERMKTKMGGAMGEIQDANNLSGSGMANGASGAFARDQFDLLQHQGLIKEGVSFEDFSSALANLGGDGNEEQGGEEGSVPNAEDVEAVANAKDSAEAAEAAKAAAEAAEAAKEAEEMAAAAMAAGGGAG
jgi:hypothetical protein